MPVLDTAMWIGQESRIKGIPKEVNSNAPTITKHGPLKRIILHTFYKKPMANKCGNLFKSAHPQSSKRNTCVQECLRRFKNASRELPLSHIQDVIRDYMTELGHGG